MPIYLQISNVPGESTEPGYVGQFVIGSISWGGSNDVVTGSNGDFTTSFTSVSVSKAATISSPSLMLLMANPRAIPTVVITIAYQLDRRLAPSNIYTMSNALLIGYTQSSGGGTPVEDLTFIFSGISYKQIAYRNTGDVAGSDTHFWDQTTNTGG